MGVLEFGWGLEYILDMKDLQKKIEEFVRVHDIKCGAGERMLDLVSEVGEVSKEILKSTDYGRKHPC